MTPLNVDSGVWLLDRLCVEGLRFEEFRYEGGQSIPTHSHEQAFFDLSLEGCVHDHWQGAARLRTPASLTYLPIGEAHRTWQDEETWTFQVVMPEAWLRQVRQARDFADEVVLFERQWSTWAAYRLFAEFKRRDDLSPLVLEELLQELLLGSFGRTQEEPGGRPGWMDVVDDHLRTSFLDPVTPDRIAKEAGVHPAYLMRTFRRHHGQTMGEFIRELRVAHACRLLKGEMPLAEVALETQFADQSHLHRTFRTLVGMTPMEYRRLAQGALSGS
jgi:AraC family transcriptional regulator